MECPHCGHHFNYSDFQYKAHIVTTPRQEFLRQLKRHSYLIFPLATLLFLAGFLLWSVVASIPTTEPLPPVDDDAPTYRKV
ncbi:MAG: hypothetical protein HOP19_21565 [Acidobacteria bacterium]|nr:hypothetical protein [Acidobacteriota bacterium]